MAMQYILFIVYIFTYYPNKECNSIHKVERMGEMPILEDLWNLPTDLEMKGTIAMKHKN